VRTERKADIVEHERWPMKLSCWLSSKSKQMVRAEEREQDCEALTYSNSKGGLVKLYCTSGNDDGADVPERDLALPARVPAPVGALCPK